MKLHDLQDAFCGAIDYIARSASLGRQPPYLRLPESYFSAVEAAHRLNGAELLKARCPVLARLVGDGYFQFLASEFALEAARTSPFRDGIGLGFPRFLRDIERLHGLAGLSDIAELELMLVRAYGARPCEPVTLADFKSVPTERAGDLLFFWHTSADLFISPLPAVSIWQTKALGELTCDAGKGAGGESALVSCRGAHVCILPVPRGTDLLLALLMRGHSLGEAVEASLYADPSLDLRSSLAFLLEHGPVAGWELVTRHCDKPWLRLHNAQDFGRLH